jgi:hypothetical protein
MPTIDDLTRDLKALLERAKLTDYMERMLRKDREGLAHLEPIVSDALNRFERDRLTFGEQSPRLVEAHIPAPRLEKSTSLIGDLNLDKHPSEEKDIPLLRAFSENAMNSAEVPITTGGFMLAKPGMAKTPIKTFEKPSEETFGRKDSITRVFNHFHLKSSEKKFPRPFEDHDKDIETAAKNLEKALEGQL